MDLLLPGPERDEPGRSGPEPTALHPGAPSADPALAARELHIELGFGALYADPGDARSRLDAVVDLDPAGALRILAETPEAFGALRDAVPGVRPPDLAAPLAAVLADARTGHEPWAPGDGPPEPSAPDVRLEYDGHVLTLRSAESDRIERQSSPAVSSRPDEGTFDLSEARQALAGVGPLPEGVYHIHTDKVQSISTRDQVLGVIGRGAWPGGTYSWGEQRVWIHPGAPHINARSVEVPLPGGGTVPRDGFSIRGGRLPGSAGCLDLTQNDARFFQSLAETRTHTGAGIVQLVVNGSETPGGPSAR